MLLKHKLDEVANVKDSYLLSILSIYQFIYIYLTIHLNKTIRICLKYNEISVFKIVTKYIRMHLTHLTSLIQ